jgi:hypothetical protein
MHRNARLTLWAESTLLPLGPPIAAGAAAYPVDEMLPGTRLDARLAVAEDGRRTVRLGERGGVRGVDAQVHSALVQGRDEPGRHEAPALVDAHHDPVEDVELGRCHDVVDLADRLATGCVHRHVLLQQLVGDRETFVHEPQLTPLPPAP